MRVLVPARVCDICGCWPCRCEKTRRLNAVPRVRNCVCGASIVLQGFGDEAVILAVATHNESVMHRLWRETRG